MTKDEKEIVMNGIHMFSQELSEKLLPLLRNSCEFGLRKGKLAMNDWIAERCRQLADELDKYMSEDFTLADMQDYRE